MLIYFLEQSFLNLLSIHIQDFSIQKEWFFYNYFLLTLRRQNM